MVVRAHLPRGTGHLPTERTAKLFDIVSYLAGKGVRTWKAAGDEVTAWCFFCERHQRDKGRLYINVDTGVYFDHVCQASGNVRDIVRHFGDDPNELLGAASSTPVDDYAVRRAILEAATTLGIDGLENDPKTAAWLMGTDRDKQQRGLWIDTIRDARLGYISPKWSLTRSIEVPHTKEQLAASGLLDSEGGDMMSGKVLIPYISNGHVVQVRGKVAPGGKYFTGANEATRLFNSDALRGATEAVVTEGEFDALVLMQVLSTAPDARLRKMAVVALPGAGAFKREWVDLFRDCRRVFLALDPDEAGRKGAVRAKEMLGTKARIVEMPEDLPKCDWTELLVYRGAGWQEVAQLLQATGGKRVAYMTEAGERHRKQQDNLKVIPTGFSAIDAVIDGGGMRPKSVTVANAKTGVGKTLFACNVLNNQVVLGLNPELRTLFVSLEMSMEELYERFLRIYRFFEPHAEEIDVERAFPNLLICDENRLGGRELTDLINEYDEEVGALPEFVIVDHLKYFQQGQPGASTYDKATAAIMELKATAKESGAAFLVPAQVNRMTKDGHPVEGDSSRDSGAIEETADYGIGLWRPDDAMDDKGNFPDPTGTVVASLWKNRRGVKNKRANLQMAMGSLALVDYGGIHSALALRESRRIWGGHTYDEIRADYMQPPLQAVT